MSAGSGSAARRPGGLPAGVASVAAVVVVAVVGLAAGSPELARAVVGGLVIVLLPGLALAWAASPDGWRDGLAHGVAVLAGGLSTVVIGGVVLGGSPVGLSAPGWIAVLAVVLAGALVIGRRRGARLPWIDRARPAAGRPVVARRPDLRSIAVPLAAAALAVLVVGVSLRVARLGVDAQPHAGFTQLWVLPAAGGEAAFSVHNAEGTTTSYRLEVRRGGEVLRSWDEIELEPGETWTDTLAVDGGDPVEGRLFRLPEEEPYRTVTWIPGTG